MFMSTEIIPIPILNGNRIILRPPRPSDVDDRIRCGRSGEFRRMVGADDHADAPFLPADAQKWYAEALRTPHQWIIETMGRAIGHARLHSFDAPNRRARYAIGIFDATCWSQGLGTEATRLVLAYAFEVLHLHRVDLRVLAFNERAIRAYEKAGFVREGVEREGAWIAGRWESDVWMSILEQEYFAQRSTSSET